MKIFLKLNCLILLISFLGCNTNLEDVMSPNSIVVSKSGDEIFIADETANRITIVKLKESREISHIDLNAKPTGLVLSANGEKLYCTLGESEGKLIEINLSNNEVERSLIVGHTPMSPIVSKDGQTLYLCNRFENNIYSIDLKPFTLGQKRAVDREPVSISLSEKGNKLYVANHLPNGSATGTYHSAKISVIDANDFNLVKEISLPNGSNALNKICISPDEKYAYITHILARYNVPTNQVERGWINTNALSIIDLEADTYLCSVLLDDLDLGAANPFDVECSEDGLQLFVSHSGTNELSAIDLKMLHARILQSKEGLGTSYYARSLDQIMNDLSYLQDIRTRVQLNGKGAKGIALANKKAYVTMFYSGSVAEINTSDLTDISDVKLGQQPEASLERLGEIYFNDATMCKQHWQSCTSCHPGNARVDGLNWDNLNDGIGNPKNTKSMLLAHATAPSMITGIRANAKVAVRAGIEHALFSSQPESVALAIDAYLSSLTPVPSPHLKNGQLSESAKRGKVIFQKSQCIQCHSGAYLTNQNKYDVGIGTGVEEGRKFDTPSLVEIWRTAPYLYNGKAKDLNEVFTTFNKAQKHGQTAHLSSKELEDLIEYCLSL